MANFGSPLLQRNPDEDEQKRILDEKAQQQSLCGLKVRLPTGTTGVKPKFQREPDPKKQEETKSEKKQQQQRRKEQQPPTPPPPPKK